LDESSRRCDAFLNAKNLHFSIVTFDFRHERPLSERSSALKTLLAPAS
jgi:hypothetical protein